MHGTNGLYNIWDEWGFSIQIDSGVEYGKLVDASFYYVYDGKTYGSTMYPSYCAFTCHWDSTYSYRRSPFNEAKAVARNGSGTPGVLDNGDTVTIYFSDSTNGYSINESNIDTVLALSGAHTWVDDAPLSGLLTAVWSSTGGKTNNVLTITISDTIAGTKPSVAVGDSINIFTYDGSHNPVPPTQFILDVNGTPVRGKMTLKGSF